MMAKVNKRTLDVLLACGVSEKQFSGLVVSLPFSRREIEMALHELQAFGPLKELADAALRSGLGLFDSACAIKAIGQRKAIDGSGHLVGGA